MEAIEDIVIVGAGLAGLATALGLHKKGIRSVVLESSEVLRAAGFAITTWTNAWKALDALGIGDELRRHHLRLEKVAFYSAIGGGVISERQLNPSEGIEVRTVRRDLLVEALAKKLPKDTIRYSSKVVSIEESENLKVLQLADGSTLKTKVLIGCDGVNSVVSEWLGLKKPSFSGRLSTRGFTQFPNGHGFSPELALVFGLGFRAGVFPCDEKTIYWFFNRSSSSKDKEMEKDARQFVITRMKETNVPKKYIEVIERSDLSGLITSPLRYRWPLELLWGNICKDNVTVAGDAWHPMTPELAQGGCSALEDGVVLARCLAEAFKEDNNEDAKEEQIKIRLGLEKYVTERKWRGIDLVTTSYVIGGLQLSNNTFVSFLRENVLGGTMARILIKKSCYDCGEL